MWAFNERGLMVELWEGYVENTQKNLEFSTHLDSIAMGLKYNLAAVLD